MNHELEILYHAVKQAGQEVMRMAEEGFETHEKDDGSPVTSADLAVNRILQDNLLRNFPQDGWLSEENADDHIRLERNRVWVVDPIDGTKYFMRNIPQFSISVALVTANTPVLGVVYNPATEELFSAIAGQGLLFNGKPAGVTKPVPPRLRILANPSRISQGQLKPYAQWADIHPMGSIAYSLALVAAGRADGTINFDLLHEWDVAAGWLLVQEGGGLSTDAEGQTIRFNQENPILPGILAARKGVKETFASLIGRPPPP